MGQIHTRKRGSKPRKELGSGENTHTTNAHEQLAHNSVCVHNNNSDNKKIKTKTDSEPVKVQH